MYDGVARKSATYLFLGQTTSLCETCLGLVPAKIIEEDGGIYYSKRCPEHGVMKTLVSDDPAYWRRTLEYLKPGDRPLAPHHRHGDRSGLGRDAAFAEAVGLAILPGPGLVSGLTGTGSC